VALILLVCAAATVALWKVAGGGASHDGAAKLLSAETEPVTLDAETVARIEAFCGDCHAVPLPDSFPRYAWHAEVTMGYSLYAKSGRQDLQPPRFEETYAYYRQHAPEQLTFPEPAEAPHSPPVRFEVERIAIEETGGVKPAVSHLNWLQLQPAAEPELIVTDMRRGTVMAMTPGRSDTPPRLLAALNQPCHVEACDLDGDGATDLVVADLGSFGALDHDRGRVVWLRPRDGGRAYEPIVVASGVGRVDDVRPADFDQDGDLDLVVAVFGADRTGDVRVLWNVAEPGEPPRFTPEIVDPRPGTIHVLPNDFDGDGYLDFVALISQEHEQVALFINQRGRPQPTVSFPMVSFHMQSLWEGPDLTFGSNGLQLVDVDADGDIDLLYTNGDAFDNGFVNPRHGVQWLENQGQLRFVCHRLTDLVGACVASAGDFDRDDDLDIVAVSWLPDRVEPANFYDRPRASIVYLEQTAPRTFVRHTLEENSNVHAALQLADFDGDGDLDFAVGYAANEPSPAGTRWVDIWWNQLLSGRAASPGVVKGPKKRPWCRF